MHELRMILRNLEKQIIDELSRIGILFRIFSRVKDLESAKKKIEQKKYKDDQKLQDLIGLRINLYFADDIDIVISLLKRSFNINNEEIDKHSKETFKPTRTNLVFNLDQENKENFYGLINNNIKPVDATFEVQIRTVFSEGWHEVEHDLRYKQQDSWNSHTDLSRVLNGIYATLETSEWAMVSLFNELAYRHYKNNQWEEMLRNKFRIRLVGNLKEEITQYLDSDKDLAKKFYKANRKKLLNYLCSSKIHIPLICNNLVFILNHLFAKNEDIHNMASEFIRNDIECYLQS